MNHSLDGVSNKKKKIVLFFGTSANPLTKAHVGIIDWLTTLEIAELGSNKEDGFCQQIIVAPVYRHPYAASVQSKSNLVAFEDRLALARLALSGEVWFQKETVKVSNIEKIVFDTFNLSTFDNSFESNQSTALQIKEDHSFKSKPQAANQSDVTDIGLGKVLVGTVDVIEFLQKQEPDVMIIPVLGTDAFDDVLKGKWKNSHRILSRAPIIIIGRDHASATCSVHYPQDLRPSIKINWRNCPDSLFGISSTLARSAKNEDQLREFLPKAGADRMIQYMKEHCLYQWHLDANPHQ